MNVVVYKIKEKKIVEGIFDYLSSREYYFSNEEKTLTTFLANHSATYLAELSCRRALRISSENFFPLAGKCQR